MKSMILRMTLVGTLFFGVFCGAVRAQTPPQDNDGCTNATLHGDYAFTVSGQVFFPATAGGTLTVQREGIAMTHFDGMGGLKQVDFVLSSPNASALPPPPGPPPSDPVTKFHNGETGSYTVYSDCTGTFTIQNPDFVGTTVPGPTITVFFVLSDGGRTIHTVVTSLIPPGMSTPVPALIHSEGHKLGLVLPTVF